MVSTAHNALQQIAYFSVVFIFGPLAILTGIAMSPAVVNRFPWYARLFGGRQSARSIHFLTMLSFFAFIVVHVTLIVMTGFARNMNHIVLGTDDQGRLGMILGFVGIGVVILSWVAAHYLSWRHPRGLQHALKFVVYPMQLLTLNKLAPQQHYSEQDISPYFWPNGKVPVSDDWKHLAEGGFMTLNSRWRSGRKSCRAFAFRHREVGRDRAHYHAPLHPGSERCREVGWNSDEDAHRIRCVRNRKRAVASIPLARRSMVVHYYDTQSMENVLKPQCLLAFADEWQAASGNLWRSVRLRVENQLGYKMVKWIERIELSSPRSA